MSVTALSAFIGEVERPPVPDTESRLRELSSGLRDLAADKTWLAPYLESHPVEMSPAGDRVITLHRDDRYLVRATIWPTAWRWVPRSKFHVYHPHVAHTHRFAVLTCGYSGPGYGMTSYHVDPDAVPAVGGNVELFGRYDHEPLAPLETRIYLPFTFAHVQRPPVARSVSLSLIVWTPNPAHYPPLFIDTRTQKRVA